MTLIGILLLVFIVVHFLLEWYADVLNLRNFSDELPNEFQDVYDAQEYAKSQNYTKDKTRLGWISGSISTITFIGFWLSGGFNWLHSQVVNLKWAYLPTALSYIAILALASSLISLPFSLYNTFVLEQRYGFNKTTWKLWITDQLKGLALMLVLGVPVLSALLLILEQVGDWAWLYAFVLLQIFSLIIQFIAPTWIMPLFNKFTPLEEGDLKTAITNFAKKVQFDIKNIFVIDGSKRSTKSNAFFTGFGKNKRIALYDTLIENHTVDELVGVLAHEIGHYKHKHVLKFTVISVLNSFITFALLGLFLREPAIYKAFFMDSTPIYAGLIFFSLLMSPIDSVLSFFLNKLSRKHEFEADAYAAKNTGNSTAMISALKKLSRHNLSNLTPHPFYVKLHYSHPPLVERVEALTKIR